MIEIRERDFTSFFDVPFRAYSSAEPYVSPLKSDLKRFLTTGVNPLFETDDTYTYYTALKEGVPAGRIVVHVHKASNTAYGINRCSFGFFDCVDDPRVARALLDKAESWARQRGFSELVGNFNLTAMQQMGVQTDHFDRPGYTDMVLNPPYIPALLAAHGFTPFFPMTTYDLDLAEANVPQNRLDNAAGHSFAPIKRKVFTQRMEDARIVLNDGFSENPMFVPLLQAEFQFQAGEMMTIMDPRLSSVLMQGGRPMGVVICIPDLNGFLRATRSRFNWLTPFHYLRFRLRRRRAVIIFYSVIREQHGQGVMAAMLARTLTMLRGAGYTRLGITWIADENRASLRQMERMGAKPLHRLHLFRKDLA